MHFVFENRSLVDFQIGNERNGRAWSKFQKFSLNFTFQILRKKFFWRGEIFDGGDLMKNRDFY